MSERIDRRYASSGQVEYSDPVELHDSSQLRIDLVPFFIGRTKADELACKIIRYDKRTGWKQTSISLQEPALRRLRDALTSHLLITEEGSGAYIVLRADGTVSDEPDLSADQVARAIEELFQTEGIRDCLSDIDLGAELVHALKTDIRLRELREAVSTLANHLREGAADESLYQNWCERHSWAFGNAYVVNDQVRAISASDKIDLLLPRNLGGFRDLIELKRPDKQILIWDAAHKSWHWSADVSRAIGQCHRYLDVLHTEVGLSGLRDAPDVIAYHPRATIVIGRSEDWPDEKQQALHGLNRRLADISVISYDHLLAQARRTLALVESPEPEEIIIVPSEPDWDFEDEPF